MTSAHFHTFLNVSHSPMTVHHKYSRPHRGLFPRGPNSCPPATPALSVEAEWISSGMTTARWHPSLFCFLPLLHSPYIPFSFYVAVLPPGATDPGRATHTLKHPLPCFTHSLTAYECNGNDSTPQPHGKNRQQNHNQEPTTNHSSRCRL
ncbi:hypothetical protein OYC64_020324 [Pagothenia borchgrevinki]|uniref:Uncharacterized protein n=1 Tax=Pagothenia borchgrevinki TaxID=8213 RepID=A0ABD2FL71_PAGBO